MSTAQGQEGAGPEPEPENDSRGWSWWWLLLPVFYLLSIGPAARLHQACPSLQKPIEAVYLPVTFLCQRVPSFGLAVGWYLGRVWGYPVPVMPK